jgi:hypothetical protein
MTLKEVVEKAATVIRGIYCFSDLWWTECSEKWRKPKHTRINFKIVDVINSECD